MEEILRKMFIDNKYLWVHMLGGAVGAKIFNIIFSDNIVLMIVFLIALGWEALELIRDDVKAIYGSLKNFLLDALGDIIGACFMAWLIVL